MSVQALVIDDDEFVRATLVRQLEAIGVARVVAMPDWGAARVQLDRYPDCNVVVSDLDMPGAAGSSFLDELAAARPGMALILVSATDPLVREAAERRARRLPLRVLGCLAKPSTFDTLRGLISEVAP